MSRPGDESTRLDAGDAQLVERLRDGYGPETTSPARRAAFNAALRQRLGRRPWRAWTLAAATTACALALAWLALPGRAPHATPVAIPAASLAAWEAEVFFPEELGAATAADDDEQMLPADYLALASAFDL